MEVKVLYPGSFDPITNGHLDVIEKVQSMFDDVSIVVAHNEHKNYMFSLEERREMVEAATDSDVVSWSGMMGNLIKGMNERIVIVRGLRDNVDFHDEMMYESYTREYGADTIYLSPRPENVYVSSSLVRAHIQTGSVPFDMIPEEIIPFFVEKV